MPGRPQALILSMLLSLFVMNDGRTHAQSLPTVRSSRLIEFQSDSKPGYFTVLGQVAKPGVYETSKKSVSLNEVIQRAGGQTANAAGSVRIVRGNRASISIMLPARYSLASGDVVVVERKRTFSSTVIQPNRSLSSQTNSESKFGIQQFHSRTTSVRQENQPELIQLAFVNLVDRPVVVAVKKEHANLPAVAMTLLKQNPGILRKIRVIPGESTASRQQETELTNGSILVFEANAVDLAPVPELPKPLQWDANQSDQIASELPGTVTVEESLATNSLGSGASIPAPIEAEVTGSGIPAIISESNGPGSVPEESSENISNTEPLPMLNLDEAVVGNNNESDYSNSESPSNIFTTEIEAVEEDVPPPPVLRTSKQSNTAIAMAPLSLDGSLRSEEPKPIHHSENSGGLELLPAVKPGSSAEQGAKLEVPVPLELVNQDVLPQSNQSDLSTVGLLASFAVIIAVLSVIASAVWSKIDEQSGMTAEDAASQTKPQIYQPEEAEIESPRQFIQQLIEDTVPINEEPVEIAPVSSLFGEPVASRTYRVDASHLKESEEYVVPQPHFVNKTQAAPVNTPTNATINSEPVAWDNEIIDSNRYRVDPPDSDSMGPSALLERANDVIQREKQREHRS